jgi:hypothetical protein
MASSSYAVTSGAPLWEGHLSDARTIPRIERIRGVGMRTLNISIYMKGVFDTNEPPGRRAPEYQWRSVAKGRVVHAFEIDKPKSVCGRVMAEQAQTNSAKVTRCKRCLDEHVVEIITHPIPDLEKLNYGDSYLVETTIRGDSSRTHVYFEKISEEERKHIRGELADILFRGLLSRLRSRGGGIEP